MLTREAIRATTQGHIPKPDNYRYGTKLTEWEPAETQLSRDQFIRQVQPMHDRIVVQLLGEEVGVRYQDRIVLTDAKPLIGGCRRAKVLKTGPGRWVPGDWWKVRKFVEWCPETESKLGPIIGAKAVGQYVHDWQWFPGYRRPVSVLPGQVVLIGNWVDLELEDIALCQEGDIRLSWPS